MISGCSHSSRKRTTPANRTNRAITPGANLPIPMAVPASRADSLPLRGVQVRDSAGQVFQAYTRGADSRLAPGLILTNANFSTQHSNGVTFYILEAYQILDLGSEQAA